MKLNYELTDEGAQNLVCAICEKAIRDYKYGDEIERRGIVNFFKSSYFQLLSNGKINPEDVIEYLNKRFE